MTSPHDGGESDRDERTPSAPDVDQPGGGDGTRGGTPSAPDVDQPDGGASDEPTRRN